METFDNKVLYLLVSIFMFFSISCDSVVKEGSLADQAKEETLIPVRPGIPGEQPFWNGLARRFIQVPSFDIKETSGARSYQYSAFSMTDEQTYTFSSEKPWDLLTPIWNILPVGNVKLVVEALDAEGKVIGIAGTRQFYKAAPFNGPYQTAAYSYNESARIALQNLFNQPHVQYWLENTVPDSAYDLYCYPSKIIGAVAEGMLIYAGLHSADSAQAMSIARRAADYLIGISQPADAPLAYFPPTYQGTAHTASRFKGQIMMNCPSEAARIYLDLFDRSGEKKYYQAALKIAETYLHLQLENGTWYLKLYSQNGAAVDPNQTIPIDIIELFDRLIAQYGLEQFTSARDRAYAWIVQNTLSTFNWEGQYEDIILQAPYKNLTMHQAGSFAIYILHPDRRSRSDIRTARELVRYAEDQFVIWDKPLPDENNSFDWLTPCVLEQYHFYEAVDASASRLIMSYQALYEATGEDIYLAKAVSLANNMTTIQKRYDGRYSTWWRRHDQGAEMDWINCAVFDVKVMLRLDRLIKLMNNETKSLAEKNILLLLSQPAAEEVVRELTDRYRMSAIPAEKTELLRQIVQSDPKAAGPLLKEGIQSENEATKIATLSLLGVNRSVNDAELFYDVLKSKSVPVQKALSHSYRLVAENYLDFGNEFLARHYFQSVLQRQAGYFDKRLSLKKLADTGTEGSLRFIVPYLDITGLSEFAATSYLKIWLKYKEKVGPEIAPTLIKLLSMSADVALTQEVLLEMKRSALLDVDLLKKTALNNGFITNWWIAGPFPGKDQIPADESFFPEQRIDFSDSETIEGHHAHWQFTQPLSPVGMISFPVFYDKMIGVAYAYTEITLPDEEDYVFRVGSNDGFACWVNGELIYENLLAGRALRLDQDRFRVRLGEGINRIFLKITNLGGDWAVCLRISDAKDHPFDLSTHIPAKMIAVNPAE